MSGPERNINDTNLGELRLTGEGQAGGGKEGGGAGIWGVLSDYLIYKKMYIRLCAEYVCIYIARTYICGHPAACMKGKRILIELAPRCNFEKVELEEKKCHKYFASADGETSLNSVFHKRKNMSGKFFDRYTRIKY